MSNSIFDVSGNVIAISGASRGLGREIARQFLQAGAQVVIGGYDEAEVRATADALNQEFGSKSSVPRVAGVAGDISIPQSGQALVQTAIQTYGKLDHVVCNAGIDIVKPAVDYTPDEWDKILSVNLSGSFYLAQAAANYWIKNNISASVSITSSIAGNAGIPALAPYAASKGGINQLVRTLATEWAQYGIRVNAIAPGYIDNIMEGVNVHGTEKSESRIKMFTPMGRRATMSEIAAPFVFLASPAASYITGAVIAVDGGYTAQ